jgi:hypothetical protein
VARYFLHIEADGQRFDDREGAEFPNLEAARRTALRAAAQISADDLATGVERLCQRVIIADGNGSEVLEIIVEAAVRVRAA